MRPAAEAMLTKAEEIAEGKADYITYGDILGMED